MFNQNDALVFLPVSDFVNHELVIKASWTKEFLIALIRSNIIYGKYEPSQKTWTTTEENIKIGLAYRDQTLRRQMTNGTP